MSEPLNEQHSDEVDKEAPINPKNRVSVDGDLSEAKLLYLIKLQAEENRLDYKAQFNFSGNPKDKIELVRDIIGMANTDGGYIVLGVREVTDGSLPRYKPEGLTPEECGSLDISKLREHIESFINERTNIQLQIHALSDFKDEQFAFIYIPPSEHKPIIVQRDGQFKNTNTNKNEILFRSGDIFIRKGASTTRVDQSDMRRIISEIRRREKSQWTEEILDIHTLVQRLDRLIVVLSKGTGIEGQESNSTGSKNDPDAYDGTLFYLSPEVMQDKIVDLLEKQKPFSINRYIQSANNLFYQHIPDNQKIDENKLSDIKDNYLLPILDSLTSMGVVLIETKQWEFLSNIQKAFYQLSRRAEKSQSNRQFPFKTWLWQEIIIRVYALGALLVYREHWEQAQALIKQEIDWDDYYRQAFWSRYFLIMLSRAGELKEEGWVIPAIDYIDTRSWFSNIFMSDKEEITSAVIHFDYLQCVYLLDNPPEVNVPHPYPSFAMFYPKRVEPIISKLISDERLRVTLRDVTDEGLSKIILNINELAANVPNHYMGWGGYWYDTRIQQFMDKKAGG